MTDRIELILKTQNLTPTQFADAIGIQRSSMSHILARRNKPSLDFVMKLLKRFPEINAEWLLTGKNQMFDIGAASSPTLFEDNPPSEQPPQINLQTVQSNSPIPEFEWEKEKVVVESPFNEKQNQNSDIERIIVFFTDGTFKSFT